MPETTPAALYGLYEVFASVGVTWCELTGEPAAGPRMEVRILSATGEPYRCPLGIPIVPAGALREVAQSDVIVVGDLALEADCDPRGRWPAETSWIRAQFQAGTTVASVCTGAILLADTGLLDFGDRSEGQLLYAARTRPRRHDDAVIARCQDWIHTHYAADNPVARLVAESGLPERTFARRFQAATGYSPAEYVQTVRVEEAKQLLETTTEPTDIVAQRVGYEDPTFFRRLFKRRTGVTPARYRQRFQAIRPNEGAR